MRLLTEKNLKALDEHSYTATDDSFACWMLCPWWNFAFRFVPANTSPNSLTCIGLLGSVVCCALTAVYSPNLTGEAPNWVYLLTGFGIFWHQTFDALDGKQCRRVGRYNGPIELIFDHGCDALSSTLFFVAVSNGLQQGSNINLWLVTFYTGHLTFYSVQWRSMITGSVHFARFDVTETQLVTILTMILTGVMGSKFWAYEIGIFSIYLRDVMSLSAIFVAFANLIENLKAIHKHSLSFRTVSTLIFGQVLFAISLAFTHESIRNDGLLISYGLFIGFFIAKQNNRILVAQMVGNYEVSFRDNSAIPVIVFACYAGIGTVYNTANFLNARTMILICCAISGLDMTQHFCRISSEIARHYDIGIFKIKPGERTFDKIK
ncbi:unnamed protein product [Clavelina lepadiformis]|uniref:Uncharacterized protein n=1 Tax=Clavelina lepadiformis TaxID=159417 RepID=A0ABP0FBS8_CLALP